MALEVRPKDIRDVSLKVAKKLEVYMNYTKRENRFDPRGGGYGTTSLMLPYEMLYRVTDQAILDRLSPRHSKKTNTLASKENRSRRPRYTSIHPEIYANSRRSITYGEADRLVDNANHMFSTQPIEKLQMIHRYRPRSRIEDSVELGKVKNYGLHVGSVLNSQNYLDYYKKQGLQTGKRHHSPRLQNLKQKTKSSLPPITGRSLSLTSKQQQQRHVSGDGRRETSSSASQYRPEGTSPEQHVRWMISVDEQPYGPGTDHSKPDEPSSNAGYPNRPQSSHDDPHVIEDDHKQKSAVKATHEHTTRGRENAAISPGSFAAFAMGSGVDSMTTQTHSEMGLYADDEFAQNELSTFTEGMLDEDTINADQLSEDSSSYKKDGPKTVDIPGVQENLDKQEIDVFSLLLQTGEKDDANSDLNSEKPSYIATDETLKWFDTPETTEDKHLDDDNSKEFDKTKNNSSANLEMTAEMLEQNLDKVTRELVYRILADLDEDGSVLDKDVSGDERNDRELDLAAQRLIEAILKQVMDEEELETF